MRQTLAPRRPARKTAQRHPQPVLLSSSPPPQPTKAFALQKPNEGGLSYAGRLAVAAGGVGVPIGFFQAHEALKHMSIQDKLVRMNSFRVATPLIVGPVATLAAAGAAYAATDCAAQAALGGPTLLTSVLGSVGVGAVFGLQRSCIATGVGSAAACAGAILAADFFQNTAQPAFEGVKRYGPKEEARPSAA